MGTSVGYAVNLAFLLAHHGSDGRHVLPNIAQAAKDLGLNFDDWLRRIKKIMCGDETQGIEGVLLQPTREAASTMLLQAIKNWPPKLKAYVVANKAEQLLAVLSYAGRVEAGRVDGSGRACEPETRSAESVHAQQNRMVGGSRRPILELVDGMKAHLSVQYWNGMNGRMGINHLTLKEGYSHLSLEHRVEEFELAGDNDDVYLPGVHLGDIIGAKGEVGAEPNKLDRSRPSRSKPSAGSASGSKGASSETSARAESGPKISGGSSGDNSGSEEMMDEIRTDVDIKTASQ
jgi:hypothetical protein